MDPFVHHPRSLRHMDSQETFVSLMQLDPAPMDYIDVEKDLPELPKEQPFDEKGGSVGKVGLSGSGHGSVYYLARIQKYSSYAFTLFTSIHFANTAVIPLIARSVPASETYLIQAREIYQSPFAEPLLVGLPVLVHVASGIALRLVRRSQNIRRYGADSTPGLVALHGKGKGESSVLKPSVWPALSWISASGYWFLGFVGAHVAANRVLPIMFDGDSSNIGLGFVAHGFARHKGIAHAAYVGLIGAGCAHMVWGTARWWGVAPSTSGWWGKESHHVDRKEKKRRRRRWMAVNGAVLIVGGTWAAGGLGVVARGGEAMGWMGTLYDGLYSQVWLSLL